MPLVRSRPSLFGLICGLAALATPAAAPAAPTPEPPPVTIRPLAPDETPTLPYWPFAPGDAAIPGLDAIPIDATLRPDGCGPLTWSRHPVPGAEAPGPFCVALIEAPAAPLLVVGRPGAAPYVIAPTRMTLDHTPDGRRLTLGGPIAALPGLTAAVRRWAAAPEAGR